MRKRNPFPFGPFIPRTSIFIFFLALLASGVALASGEKKDQITRGEFIKMMARHQSDNPMLPKGHAQLSSKELYAQTNQNLSNRGFKVFEGKSINEPLTDNEFVRATYAFTGEPTGKNLFEQKLYLKKAGIINSADVGLATGLEGKAFQIHKGKSVVKLVKLASPVFMKDRIETNPSSKTTFTFDDKSTLTLGEDSAVNINKHIYNPDKDFRQTIVQLTRGIVRFSVTKGKAEGSMFKVITPTATAGVRGTEFVVMVDAVGKTTFLVLEGQIETRPILPNGNEGRMALVSQGESHVISKNGKATLVKKAPPGLIISAKAKTSKPKNIALKKVFSKQKAQRAVQLAAKIRNTGGSKNSYKALAKNKAKNSVKSVAKNLAKLTAKNQAKLTAKNFAKLAAKTAAKITAKAFAKLAAKTAAKNSAKETAKQLIKEQGKNAGKENGNGNGNGNGKGKGK